MSLLNTIFRLVRRALFWLLIVYWIVFVTYTFMNLVTSGPVAVVGWYRHIDRAPQWSAGMFLARQNVILAITIVLGLSGRRTSNHEAITSDPK
jgi:hypothetical protein